MTVLQDIGTLEVDVPADLQMKSSLDDHEVREIAALAARLEDTCGYPVDVECAIAGGVLYLLQCRPITTLR
jgi:pyruvate,water dikinase